MLMPTIPPTSGTAAASRSNLLEVAFVVACMAAAVAPQAARGQQVQGPGTATDVTAIRVAAAAYRQALAKGDAAAMRAMWTADGDIVDGWGNRLRPQDADAIGGGPVAADKPRPEFRVTETQLRFITADVALEDGTVDVVLPGMKTPLEGWFSAIWVRSGGDWKLAGLRESERPVAADADTLADLDWMEGDWLLTVEGDAGKTDGKAAAPGDAGQPVGPTEMRVRWDAGRAFLVREVRVPGASPEDGGAVEVQQRIGWDPLVRRIRSWSFSSDGSRGEGTWFRDGDSWVVVHTAVLPSGRQDTVVHVYSQDGQDRIVWRTLPEGLEADEGRPTRATWVRKPKGVER